ncbi:hypothetical protein Vi05172_g11225 [Venturia inaequalis]|nr:hypothetical protein Vi05172_g11225 [Venturia inaequalis]
MEEDSRSAMIEEFLFPKAACDKANITIEKGRT